MKVTLIASTKMHDIPSDLYDTKFGRQFNDRPNFYHWEDRHFDADTLAHFAGRACYQAWDMPRESTSTDDGYLNNIINQAHFSVLEHASATFYIEGVSRNLTHELIRHRHLSYSELSQRFVDMEEASFVVPPAVREHFEEDDEFKPVDGIQPLEAAELWIYRTVVDNLLAVGKTRKEAREAARAYLPSAMETKIVVTGNMRAFRDMLYKRYSVHADAEIRELSSIILAELRSIAPASFQDFPDAPFGS